MGTTKNDIECPRLEIKCEHSKAVNPSELKDHPRNANKHPAKQINALAANIKEFGWRHPIVVSNLSGCIVMGHGRRDAAIKLGCNAPVDYQDFKSEDEELAVLVSDNVIPELADMDEELLKANKDLIEAAGFDLEMIGFEEDEPEPDTSIDAEPKIDQAAELQEQWGTKLGQLWTLGHHRVFCGDSTLREDVDLLMDGHCVDICFTSPPYNAGQTPTETKMGMSSKYASSEDNLESEEYFKLLLDFTVLAIEKSEYTFVNIQSLAGNKIPLICYLYNMKDFYSDTIIWDKLTAQPAMANNVLNSQFEYIHIFSKKATRRIGTLDFRGTISNVLSVPKQTKNKNTGHHATFSIEFASSVISKFSTHTVYDPFLGSGTSLIACEQLGRKCYGMELDPKYVAVILERYKEATGKEPTRTK
jgi:DNA modification methylase